MNSDRGLPVYFLYIAPYIHVYMNAVRQNLHFVTLTRMPTTSYKYLRNMITLLARGSRNICGVLAFLVCNGDMTYNTRTPRTAHITSAVVTAYHSVPGQSLRTDTRSPFPTTSHDTFSPDRSALLTI